MNDNYFLQVTLFCNRHSLLVMLMLKAQSCLMSVSII